MRTLASFGETSVPLAGDRCLFAFGMGQGLPIIGRVRRAQDAP